MKALVIYDSFFGNTEKIALEIGEHLGPKNEVKILKVNRIRPDDLEELDLLVVGSPTRKFSPSPAVSKFLKNIPKNGLTGIKTAAFDTRMSTQDVNVRIYTAFVKVFDYAASSIAKKMKQKGANLIAEPEGFLVKDSEGPLKDGELQRAAEWAKQIRSLI